MSNTGFRYDVAPIDKYELTPEGYLRVHATIARTGVQHYSNADGSIRREYRAPEDVALPESLASFAGKSVTDEHPPVLLDSTNTKNYQKGFTGTEIVYDNGFVRAVMTVTDQELIDKIQRGDASEVSAGYRVDFDANPGTTADGEHYDGRQKDIKGNHVAVVKTGRAGPQVKLHLDRQDAADPALFQGAANSPVPHGDSMTTAKVVFDSAEFDVSEGVALAINKERADAKTSYEAMKKQYDAMCEQASKMKEEMDAMEKEMKGKCDAAEGRADALAADNASLKEELTEAQAVNLDSLVEKRLTLIEKAKPVLDSAYVFAGKTEREIMVDAVKAVRGDSMDLTERSDDYVLAAFDTLATENRSDSSTGPLRQAVMSLAPNPAPNAYWNTVTKGYQRPLTATKGA